MSSHSNYHQTEEKLIFNLDFNIPYEEISYFPNYEIENERLYSNQTLIEDINLDHFLNKKRPFSIDLPLKDGNGNCNYDLNYSRVTSKATSADSSSYIPVIFPSNEINNCQNFLITSSSCENMNLSSDKKSNINLSFKFNDERDCFNEYNLQESESNQINQVNSKNKMKIEENPVRKMNKQKNKTQSGNPINKIIEIITKENITLDNKHILNYLIKKDDNPLFLSIKNEKSEENIKRKILFSSSKYLNKVEKEKSSRKICCSCQKSHCLKLYCECFKNQNYCQVCSCPNCLNKEKFDMIRQESITFLKSKSKYAFKSVGIFNENKDKVEHIKGCKCKNSNCQKNYCECYQNGMKCGGLCRCVNCLNENSC